MTDSDKKIKGILKQYKEYLEAEEAKEHLQRMDKEKNEVQEIMDKLSQMDKKSAEFTELVLYGLLPYSNTKVAKRVSLFPAFMNIRIFFKEYNYSDEEWNLVANRIFNLCTKFKENPKDPHARITNFSIPKEEFNQIFSKEELQKKKENNWHHVCHICRDNKIDTSEINYQQFINMQLLDKNDKK